MNLLIFTLALISTLWQLWGIKTKRVIAPKASWIIWGIIGAISLLVSLGFKGWNSTSWMLFGLTIGNIPIVIYIIRHRPGRFTKRDKQILIATGIIILIWLPFKFWLANALLWATAFSQLALISAHFLGVWNHWTKVWKDPFTEVLGSWVSRLALASIAFVVQYDNGESVVAMLPAIYAGLAGIVIVCLIPIRRKALSSPR